MRISDEALEALIESGKKWVDDYIQPTPWHLAALDLQDERKKNIQLMIRILEIENELNDLKYDRVVSWVNNQK